jgi:hypothetical protein
MHCTTLAVSLLRGVRGVDHGGRVLEGMRLWGVAISLAQVVVEVRYRVGYCVPQSVIVIVLVVICYKCVVMLCVVDLNYGDMVL